MQGADGYRQAYDLVGQFPFLHADPLLKTCEIVRRFVKNWLTTLRALGGAAFHPAEDTGLSADARQAGTVTTGRAPATRGGRLTGASSTARQQVASRC